MPNLSPDEKKQLISQKMRDILEILGLDLTDPSLAETPNRVAKMYVDEIFSGLDPKKFPTLSSQEEEQATNELVLVKNVSFVSFCEHHFVPFVGKAHVAYIPKKRLLGLSKIPHVVRYFAKRPQLQERLTKQISDALISFLEIEDVAVVLQAFHFCVMARGVEDSTAELETHVLKGRFEQGNERADFFARIAEPISSFKS